jgi:mono/diheme cytochrome c family protein
MRPGKAAMRTVLALLISAAALVASNFVPPALGGESRATPASTLKAEPELIPGAYLMTPAEREQYRQRMQAAPSAQEKARIRSEHIEVMEQRARGVGLALNLAPVAKRGDPARGSALHNVCFSCHGPERYVAAKERAESFLASSIVVASGIESTAVGATERHPESLPPGAPRMAKSQLRNVAGLKRAVTRWNDFFNPRLSESEIDDLVAYLNAAYYKF